MLLPIRFDPCIQSELGSRMYYYYYLYGPGVLGIRPLSNKDFQTIYLDLYEGILYDCHPSYHLKHDDDYVRLPFNDGTKVKAVKAKFVRCTSANFQNLIEILVGPVGSNEWLEANLSAYTKPEGSPAKGLSFRPPYGWFHKRVGVESVTPLDDPSADLGLLLSNTAVNRRIQCKVEGEEVIQDLSLQVLKWRKSRV